MPTSTIKSLNSIGLNYFQTNTASIWCCPEVDLGGKGIYGKVYPNPNGVQWQLGYQYLGGVTIWKNSTGNYNSCSPVKLSTAKPGWMLAADNVLNDGVGLWVNCHTRPGVAFPDGGNEVFVDGSVRWFKIETMYRITTYDLINRLWYFYQDDLSPIPAAKQALLKFPN